VLLTANIFRMEPNGTDRVRRDVDGCLQCRNDEGVKIRTRRRLRDSVSHRAHPRRRIRKFLGEFQYGCRGAIACVAESQGLHDCFSAGPGTLTYSAHSAEPECLTPARSRSRKCGVTERSFGDRCPRRPSRISNEKALRKPWFHFIEECREGRPTVMLRIRSLKVPTGRCKLTTWP
jgi:hypothetical protein